MDIQQPTILDDELNESVHSLRGSLTELIASAGGDARKPQEVSRRFGIDKSLAWKVSRVIKAMAPHEALTHVPGAAAFEILFETMERAGATMPALNRAREAAQSFHDVVQKHVGDRPTLELVVDALPTQNSGRLSLSRKLAFRGNSGIWGVQARVRTNTIILAPNAERPDMVDSLLVGGWVDFRRLRPDAAWTLFRRRAHRSGQFVSGQQALDPDEPADGPMFLRDFCSASLPPINAIENDGTVLYELGPSAVGNTGAFTCFFGTLHRGLGSRFADGPDDNAEFHAMISAPVETLVFDFIVHQALTFAMKPEMLVYGVISPDVWAEKQRNRLPIVTPVQQLGARPPVMNTPLIPEYSRVIDHAFNRAGWSASDFTGVRFVLDYPPFPSTVTVRVPLESKPK